MRLLGLMAAGPLLNMAFDYNLYGGGGGYPGVDGQGVLGGMRTTGMEVIGVTPQGQPILARRAPPTHHVPVHRPEWRDRQLAPGVHSPGEGLWPLPLRGTTGTNTFTAALTQITFQGSIQKPFRGERLLIRTTPVGTSATGTVQGQFFVGTDLQAADIDDIDYETIGQAQGFGVRMQMNQAEPGVLLRLRANLTSPLTGSDTIQVSVTLLGSIVA